MTLAQVEHLSPRWRLDHHPLFNLARSRLNPAASPRNDCLLAPSSSVPGDRHNGSVYDDAFMQIVVPNKSLMHHHLMEKARELVAIGCRSNAHYQKTMAMFNHMLTEADTFGDMLTGIRAPLPKKLITRGRPAIDELRNKSSLDYTSGKKRKLCSTCKKNGVDADDHRKGGKCPFSDVALPAGLLTVTFYVPSMTLQILDQTSLIDRQSPFSNRSPSEPMLVGGGDPAQVPVSIVILDTQPDTVDRTADVELSPLRQCLAILTNENSSFEVCVDEIMGVQVASISPNVRPSVPKGKVPNGVLDYPMLLPETVIRKAMKAKDHTPGASYVSIKGVGIVTV